MDAVFQLWFIMHFEKKSKKKEVKMITVISGL